MTGGPSPEDAAATLILLHGRGASASGILDVHAALRLPEVAALAPQARDLTWYPRSFMAPQGQNQPWLDSAIARVESIVVDLDRRGVAAASIAIFGFSQGACLACEYVVRHPRRYGALIACTGALISDPAALPANPAALTGVSVFLGAGDPDAHVPFDRVRATAHVLQAMGARVDLRRYEGLGHMINDDELAATRACMEQIVARRG